MRRISARLLTVFFITVMALTACTNKKKDLVPDAADESVTEGLSEKVTDMTETTAAEPRSAQPSGDKIAAETHSEVSSAGEISQMPAMNVPETEGLEIETDILIVGAGGAGLSAANIAVREGKDVLVIEKTAAGGGATAVSNGSFMGGGSQLQIERGTKGDTPEIMYQDLLIGGEDNNKALLRLFVENCGPTADWLYYDLGLPIDEDGPSYSPEHTYDRGFKMVGGAPAITSELQRAYEEEGGEILFETRAQELIVENGAVKGVIAEGPGGKPVTIRAGRVVLATGGYGNNKSLLPESALDILYYGPESSTGDGLLMAQKAGAGTWFMDRVEVYPHGIETASGKGKSSSEASMAATKSAGGIYVNKEGKRVINENLPMIDIKKAVMEQPDQKLYLFMDQSSFDMFSQELTKSIPVEEVDKYVEQNGGVPMFANGPTVDEAAAAAGVDQDGLLETFFEWNDFVDNQQDDDFGRKEFFEIGEGPYYLVEQKLRYASTLGGLKVNDSLQVLDMNDKPVEGLYAAGEIVGGVHGKESMPSSNLGWALTSGRLAGIAVSGR